MKEVETKYINEANVNTNQEIKEKKEKINYDFIVKILKSNIGIEIDNFFKINVGQKITKYNTDSFTRYAILSLEKSKQEIIEKFEKILNKKY